MHAIYFHTLTKETSKTSLLLSRVGPSFLVRRQSTRVIGRKRKPKSRGYNLAQNISVGYCANRLESLASLWIFGFGAPCRRFGQAAPHLKTLNSFRNWFYKNCLNTTDRTGRITRRFRLVSPNMTTNGTTGPATAKGTSSETNSKPRSEPCARG